MEAIQLTGALRGHPYACRGINIDPDPPEVGRPSTISLALVNQSPAPITVSSLEISVARFGIGVLEPEHLAPIGPLELPADPNRVEQLSVTWTPVEGGHRCIQARIQVEAWSQPLRVRRNLQVIEAGAEQRIWHIPFRLGNPEAEPAALVLRLADDPADGVAALVLVKGQGVPLGQPIQLGAREEVDAVLVLLASHAAAGEIVRAIEATSRGRLLDGIQVLVRRSAALSTPVIERTPHEALAVLA